MLGWLKKRSENAQAAMCVSETKWRLQSSEDREIARILAMAQLLRHEVLYDFSRDVFDAPRSCERRLLTATFNAMVQIRMTSKQQLSELKQNMPRLGLTLPDMAIKHVERSDLALMVWMATLSAGISDRNLVD